MVVRGVRDGGATASGGGVGTELARQSSRQAQAENLQTLLSALYSRYARAFRRIAFALGRVVNAMPPAPAGQVRTHGRGLGEPVGVHRA